MKTNTNSPTKIKHYEANPITLDLVCFSFDLAATNLYVYDKIPQSFMTICMVIE